MTGPVFGVHSGPCVQCGYFYKKEGDKRERRLCIFSGRHVYGQHIEADCIGFHPRPRVGDLWATT